MSHTPIETSDVTKQPILGALSKDKEPGPLKGAVNALLIELEGEAGFAGGAADDRPKKFAVLVGTCTLLFRYPQSIREIEVFKQKAFEFLQRMKTGHAKKNLPKPYMDALGDKLPDESDLLSAFGIHYWSDPSEKIDETQGIRIVRANAVVASQLVERVDEEMRQGKMAICFGGVREIQKKSPPTERSVRGSRR